LALEEPRKSVFFAKMALKTTSGSGFHFIFRFAVVEKTSLHFFEKFHLKVEKLKKIFKRVTKISETQLL